MSPKYSSAVGDNILRTGAILSLLTKTDSDISFPAVSLA